MKYAAAFLLAFLLLAAAAPAPAQAQFCGVTYTVRAGDTLYSIAEECGISYVVLISINYEISDPSKIYPGQVIRLEAEVPLNQYRQPASGPGVDAGYQEGGTYVVRKNDSISRIAYLYGTTISEIVRYNPILRQRLVIVPGQVLVLPPEARRGKGWVGVSANRAEGGDDIEVRVVDFPAYAMIEMNLMLREEEDFSYFTVQVQTDARGDARAVLEIPWYAWEDEIYEVHVTNLDDGDQPVVKSPGILIVD